MIHRSSRRPLGAFRGLAIGAAALTISASIATPVASAATNAAESRGLAEVLSKLVDAEGDYGAPGLSGLVVDPDGVRVSFDVDGLPADVAADIERVGARLLHVSDNYSRVTADVPWQQLRPAAAIAGVRSVDPVAPTVSTPRPTRSKPRTAPRSGTNYCGRLTSRAGVQMGATAARQQFGVDGTGVKVGVISNSFAATTSPTSVQSDIAGGALPGPGNPCGRENPVQVVQDFPLPGGDDEGRAMVQEVHGMAPGAQIFFATSGLSDANFADNIRKLTDLGVDVIVDDQLTFDEPFYQDGIIANAVTYAKQQGVTYFAAAGNQNVVTAAGQDVGSLEAAAYRPTTCPAAVAAMSNAPLDCLDFATSGPADNTAGYTYEARPLTMLMQWAEPQFGVQTDLGLFLLDGVTGDVLQYSAFSSNSPYQMLNTSILSGRPSASDIDIVVGRYSGSGTPRLKYIFFGALINAAEYDTSSGDNTIGPTIFGHSATDAALAVAAIQFDNNTTPEYFSSRGPATHYFSPTVGATPGVPLPSPQVFAGPAFAATNLECTTFFGFVNTQLGCPYEFQGTSSAAPNAAAVAALMKQLAPGLTPDQIGSILTGTASSLSGGSVASSGTGLVNAIGALSATRAMLPGTPGTPTVQVSRGRVRASWTAPANTGGPPVSQYLVQALRGGSVVPGAGCATTTTSCEITGLGSALTYTLQVTPTNSAGVGTASAPSPTFTSPRATRLIGCGRLPRKVAKRGLTRLLTPGCHTNSGARVTVTAQADAPRHPFRIVRRSNGAVDIRTFGKRLELTVTISAGSRHGFAPFLRQRIYQTRGR